MLLLLFCAASSMAQPILPDIAGATEKGIVVLSWACQYNNIRSITVLRSADSINNYSVAGHVKKKDKGVQVFADAHPVLGKNFYKLAIVFNSGLTWTSNYRGVYVAKLAQDPVLQDNDSLQKYIAPRDIGASTSAPAIASAIINNYKALANKNFRMPTAKQPAPDTSKLFAKEQKNKPTAIAPKPEQPAHKVDVSFDLDSSDAAAGMHSNAIAPPRKKLTVTFADPNVNSATFIKSRFIFTDPATGHVDVYLPDDIKSHHYALKFYDTLDQVIMEIPKLSTASIIIDKRNFQHPGTYKFIIRKDVTEFERGYVEITP